jgi:hypothetical protein
MTVSIATFALGTPPRRNNLPSKHTNGLPRHSRMSPPRSRTLPFSWRVVPALCRNTVRIRHVITGTPSRKPPLCRTNLPGWNTKGLSRHSRISPPRSETFPLQNHALNGSLPDYPYKPPGYHRNNPPGWHFQECGNHDPL